MNEPPILAFASNLTDRSIKPLPAPEKGNRIIYDDTVGGFGLRITANGAKAFVLTYRIDGRQRRMTLGGWPDLTATAAREMALEARAAIAKGVDPLGIKETRRNAPTVAELCEDYLEHHAAPHKRARSKQQDERAIERFILPRIGNLKVQAVTTRDIQDIHKALVSTPYQANRVLALLSKMMSLAVRWNWRTDNPVIGIKRYHEEAKEVALSVAESQRIMAAIEQYRASKKQGSRTADAIEILLLTGARKNEVLQMRWSDLDLDSGVWITHPAGFESVVAYGRRNTSRYLFR